MTPLKLPESHEILFLRGDINYTEFHLVNGKKVVTSYTLKKYAEMPELIDFKRINRKYLVNPKEIREIRKDKSKHFVVLLSGQELKVSRRRNNRY